MNKLKKVLCAFLSVCLITMPFACSITASAESIESLEQQLKSLDEKNQEYKAIIEQTQSDIEEKEEYIDALVKRIEVLDDKIELTRESIDALNQDIEQKQADIDQANADIEDQMATLCSRLRTIYMAGSASDLEIIFGAKDFSDFIDKMQLVKTLSNYDKELIDSINEKLEGISEQKESLEADKAELEVQQASLEADQEEFNTVLEENEETLRNLYTSNSDAQQALEEAALESEEIEKQITEYYEAQRIAAQKAAEDTAKNQNSGSNTSESNGGSTYTPPANDGGTVSPIVSSSGYTWPCPGYYYLSSEWNEDRGSYNHGAIDIAGSGIMGATVVAADSGTVISAYYDCPHNWGKSASCGCGGGYGNYVMIDHGNGKITIYAHLTSGVVSTGQYVSKGQTIGYVGSTGYSTGPHLHFECRLNGVKYNPMLEF